MSEPTSFWKRLFEDLKRRRVVRVAIGYAIAAWAIVEVCDVLLPTVDAPGWVFRAVVAAAFLGFPVTVILAWVFDISGQGVVVTESKGIRIPTWVKGVVALPLLGLVALLGWWVWSGYVEDRQSSLRPTDLAGAVPLVAVQPIRNVTGDPAVDWYGEGLANLVRDNLTRSRYLRVVSPTKWRSIVDDASDDAEIADRAEDEGIGFILSGEMVRTPGGITVSSRLTDTAGGVVLSSRQVETLSPETLLTAAGPIATQVKQGLKVPREEQVDVFAADFATDNLSAYESYIAGLQYFLNWEYAEAEQAFNAALQLAPDFAVARYRLAYIQAVTGRTEQALVNMQQALQTTYLADRERRYIEAALALFQRDYARAAGLFESLLEDYPFEIEAREMLAKAYWGDYRPADAVREIERLAVEEPQNKVIWNTLGWYLLAMGEFERAQPALERFSRLAPNDASSHQLLGDSLRYQGDFDGARTHYARALELDPDMLEVAHSLATIDFMEGRVEQAMADFQAILNNEDLIIRDRLDALFPLTSLHAARGDFPAAIELLDRFADPLKEERIRVAMATSMKALFQLERGEVESARELAQAAIGLSPGVPTRYLFARGLIEIQTGAFEQALHTAGEIAGHALPPENPDRTEEKAAAYLEGMVYLEQNRPDAATGPLERARDLAGHPYRIYPLGLARLLASQGRTDEALELTVQAVEPDPVDPRLDLEPDRVQAILLQAEIYRAAGDFAQAKSSALAFLDRFNRAQSTHPSVRRAREITDEAATLAAGRVAGGRLAARFIRNDQRGGVFRSPGPAGQTIGICTSPLPSRSNSTALPPPPQQINWDSWSSSMLSSLDSTLKPANTASALSTTPSSLPSISTSGAWPATMNARISKTVDSSRSMEAASARP
jgi:tetratricopeptide (TPR) repeat protein